MSQENVEIVARLFSVAARSDLDDLTSSPRRRDRVAETPLPGAGSTRATTAFTRFCQYDGSVGSTWGSRSRRLRAAGDRGRPLSGTGELERRAVRRLERRSMRGVRAPRMADLPGLCTTSIEEALEAAGLSEQAVSQENVELVRSSSCALGNDGDFLAASGRVGATPRSSQRPCRWGLTHRGSWSGRVGMATGPFGGFSGCR